MPNGSPTGKKLTNCPVSGKMAAKAGVRLFTPEEVDVKRSAEKIWSD
jgi:hypothetical protein